MKRRLLLVQGAQCSVLLKVGHTDKLAQCARDRALRSPTQTTAVSIRAATYAVPAPVRFPALAQGTTRRTVAVVALLKKRLKTEVGKRGNTYPVPSPVRVPARERGTTRRTVAVVALLKKRLKKAVRKRFKRVISLPLSPFSRRRTSTTAISMC